MDDSPFGPDARAWCGESEYFREVAAHFGLPPAEPGHRGRVVVLCAHQPARPPFDDYVVYNMEQLGCREMPAHFWERLRAAAEVCDFSEVNVRALAARGVRARHVPYLPHPRRGAVFAGAWNARRADFMGGLPGVTVLPGGTFGADRDAAYARAAVGLNVHYYGGPDVAIMETHRVLPMLAAGLLVVSEKSCDAYYDERLARLGVVFVDDREHFRETVRFFAARPDLAARLARAPASQINPV